MLEIACMVDGGKRSPANDDRAAVNKQLVLQGFYSETVKGPSILVVCDGVGGEAYGYEAAEISANIFSNLSGAQLNADTIKENIEKANEAVIAAQKKDFKHSKMSTTIAGLYINENDFIAFNVGDSRVYRYRTPYIMQLSTDHSLPEQKNVITRYLGGCYSKPDIVEGIGKFFDKDVFALCSDGVWGSLDSDDFEDILSQDTGLEEKCKALVSLALKKGSTDNLSIIIARRI